MYESGKQTFETLNVEGAQAIAEAAAKRGIKRVVQCRCLARGQRLALHAANIAESAPCCRPC